MLACALATLLAQAPASVSLVFGGDVIPHDAVKATARHLAAPVEGAAVDDEGWGALFGPVAGVLREADVAVVNLEAPVVQLKRPETGPLIFHGPPALLRGLRAAGVGVVTFANNHGLDQHREGIVSTRAWAADAGVGVAGADVDEARAWAPLVVERNGVRLGLLAVGRFLNGFNNVRDASAPHVPIVPYPGDGFVGGRGVEALVALVKAQARTLDALIVVMHWGDEYRAPREDDRRLAQALVDAGAVAVVGHHPHVVQPVEWLTRPDGNRAPVAFSLGNLVSNQGDGEGSATRDGLLLRLEVAKLAEGGSRVTGLRGVPIVSRHLRVRGRSLVQPVPVDAERERLRGRLAALEGQAGRAARRERRALERSLATAEARAARVDALWRDAGL